MSLPARFEDFEALASADRHIVYEYLEKDEKEWDELLRQWDEHVVHNAFSVSDVDVFTLTSAVSGATIPTALAEVPLNGLARIIVFKHSDQRGRSIRR